MAQKRKRPIAVTGVETRNLPGMPIHVEFQRMQAEVSLSQVDGEPTFQFTPGNHNLTMDQYWEEFKLASVVKDAFLAVRNPLDALSFFQATGYFLFAGDEVDGEWIRTFTWTDFQRWQHMITFIAQHGFLTIMTATAVPEMPVRSRVICFNANGNAVPDDLAELALQAPEATRAYLSGEPELKMRRDKRLADYEGRKPKLEMSIYPFGSIQAMLASLYIDTQTGIDYKLCGREKCGNLFIADDKRGKQYCSQPCAHHASVTRNRKSKENTLG